MKLFSTETLKFILRKLLPKLHDHNNLVAETQMKLLNFRVLSFGWSKVTFTQVLCPPVLKIFASKTFNSVSMTRFAVVI